MEATSRVPYRWMPNKGSQTKMKKKRKRWMEVHVPADTPGVKGEPCPGCRGIKVKVADLESGKRLYASATARCALPEGVQG